MEAAARVADAMLVCREADFAAAEAALLERELLLRQEDAALDEAIANGDVGEEAVGAVNLSGLEPPDTLPGQVEDDDETCIERLMGDMELFTSDEEASDREEGALHLGALPPGADDVGGMAAGSSAPVGRAHKATTGTTPPRGPIAGTERRPAASPPCAAAARCPTEAPEAEGSQPESTGEPAADRHRSARYKKSRPGQARRAELRARAKRDAERDGAAQ